MAEIKHVAIIMDGNGRWAEGRARPRFWGHVRGTSVISEIVDRAKSEGLKALTLYAFSSENWSRPEIEVKTIFSLLVKFIDKEKQRLIREDVIFKVIGRRSGIPPDATKAILDLEEATKNNTGLMLTVAFGYGARFEIVDAVNTALEKNKGLPLTETMINDNLYRPEIGDVDLMIRTGGDQRISNYLLWQSAYAELYFTETLWPSFSQEEFSAILTRVRTRERRFGGIGEASSYEKVKDKIRAGVKRFMR